jgi:hypothetical protein
MVAASRRPMAGCAASGVAAAVRRWPFRPRILAPEVGRVRSAVWGLSRRPHVSVMVAAFRRPMAGCAAGGVPAGVRRRPFRPRIPAPEAGRVPSAVSRSPLRAHVSAMMAAFRWPMAGCGASGVAAGVRRWPFRPCILAPEVGRVRSAVWGLSRRPHVSVMVAASRRPKAGCAAGCVPASVRRRPLRPRIPASAARRVPSAVSRWPFRVHAPMVMIVAPCRCRGLSPRARPPPGSGVARRSRPPGVRRPPAGR